MENVTLGYNARNDEIRDNVSRREWEAVATSFDIHAEIIRHDILAMLDECYGPAQE